MKRIQAACLEQTIRFASKDSSNLPLARRLAREEANRYLAQLEKSRTKYQIVKEQEAPDGSLPVLFHISLPSSENAMASENTLEILCMENFTLESPTE